VLGLKEKNLDIGLLLDFYSPVLTDKQREVLEFYYDEDMSLAEIAEHEMITRQGVRDNIKRGEKILLDMEEALGFAQKMTALKQHLEKMELLLSDMEMIHQRQAFSDEMAKKLLEFKKKLKALQEL
jgi:predicted DNA-binding protein YlxM (UPF0122 family)